MKVINLKSHVQPHQIDTRKQLTSKAAFPKVGIRLEGACGLAVCAALPRDGPCGVAIFVLDHPRQQANRNPLSPRRHDRKGHRNVQTNRSNLAQGPSGQGLHCHRADRPIADHSYNKMAANKPPSGSAADSFGPYGNKQNPPVLIFTLLRPSSLS